MPKLPFKEINPNIAFHVTREAKVPDIQREGIVSRPGSAKNHYFILRPEVSEHSIHDGIAGSKQKTLEMSRLSDEEFFERIMKSIIIGVGHSGTGTEEWRKTPPAIVIIDREKARLLISQEAKRESQAKEFTGQGFLSAGGKNGEFLDEGGFSFANRIPPGAIVGIAHAKEGEDAGVLAKRMFKILKEKGHLK